MCNDEPFPYLRERKACAPLPAAAHVDHGVMVVVMENHRIRTAGRDCHGAACQPFFLRDLVKVILSSSVSLVPTDCSFGDETGRTSKQEGCAYFGKPVTVTFVVVIILSFRLAMELCAFSIIALSLSISS